LLMIAVLPASLTYTFGRTVGRTSSGCMLFAVMTVLFTASLAFTAWAEQRGIPALAGLGPNMEGKEVRLGIQGSVLAAVTTSNGATGSHNSMHDSYTPLGGIALRPLFGPPEVGVSGLRHDGGLVTPSGSSNVIGAFCPIAPCGRSSL
jgi:K+-transporting ATPase A subunit